MSKRGIRLAWTLVLLVACGGDDADKSSVGSSKDVISAGGEESLVRAERITARARELWQKAIAEFQ